jgi:hypothetical protein
MVIIVFRNATRPSRELKIVMNCSAARNFSWMFEAEIRVSEHPSEVLARSECMQSAIEDCLSDIYDEDDNHCAPPFDRFTSLSMHAYKLDGATTDELHRIVLKLRCQQLV